MMGEIGNAETAGADHGIDHERFEARPQRQRRETRHLSALRRTTLCGAGTVGQARGPGGRSLDCGILVHQSESCVAMRRARRVC